MEVVRQEVTALMLDGIQKTASFCASQCAKHVVAARREMHQREMHLRHEFERLHGVPFRGLTPGTGSAYPSGPPTGFATPGSIAFAGTPRKMPGIPPLAPSNIHSYAASPAMSVFTAGGGQLTPRQASRPTSFVSGADEIACTTYDAYIGVHDAVQTLEERTAMTWKAMEAIEEAIHCSVDGARASERNTPGVTPAATPGHSMPGTPGQSLKWPRNQADLKSSDSASGRVAITGSALRRGGLDQRLKATEQNSNTAQGTSPPRAAAPLPSGGGGAALSGPAASVGNAGTAAPAPSTTPAGSRPTAVPAIPDGTDHALENGVGLRTAEPAASQSVKILAGRNVSNEPQSQSSEMQSEERRPGQAKYRERSIASTFSEAESIAPAHLMGN